MLLHCLLNFTLGLFLCCLISFQVLIVKTDHKLGLFVACTTHLTPMAQRSESPLANPLEKAKKKPNKHLGAIRAAMG